MEAEPLVYIYLLRDPRDGRIVYIGASQYPQLRKANHVADYASVLSEKAQWMKRLLASGHEPEIELIDVCWKSRAGDVERHWIRCYLRRGHPLMNKNLRKYGD